MYPHNAANSDNASIDKPCSQFRQCKYRQTMQPIQTMQQSMLPINTGAATDNIHPDMHCHNTANTGATSNIPLDVFCLYDGV